MSDVIFIAATIAFFAISALYVHWCDKIIGPDDFRAAPEAEGTSPGDGAQLVTTDLIGSGGAKA